jgi:hypothetical protein
MRNTVVPVVLAIVLLAGCGGKPKASISPVASPSPSIGATPPNIGEVRDGADGMMEFWVNCSRVTEADLKPGIELYRDGLCTGKEFVGEVAVRGMGDNAKKTKILLRGQQDWKNDSAIVGEVYYRHQARWEKTGLKN